MLHQNYHRLCRVLQGAPPLKPAQSLSVGRYRRHEPLNTNTRQLRRSQLFAALKIAMRTCFDNVINAMSGKEVCCDAVLRGDIAYIHELWR